jgi:hypothetical protein
MLNQRMADSIKRITLATGWQWFRDGFARYRRNPVLMVFWVMSYWTMLGLVGLVPVVGDLLVAALAPVLLVGVLAGCRALDAETMPSFTLMFSGFRNRLQPLMGLGVLHFLLTLGVLGLTAAFDGGTLLQFMARSTLGTGADATTLNPENLSLTAMLIALAVYVPVMLAFAYAPLLVAWRGFGVGKALFFSLVGSWRAWQGLMGLFCAILAFGVLVPALAMMLLVALGVGEAVVTSLVVVPLMAVLAPTVVSAFLSSYRDVVPDNEGAAPAQLT